MTIPLSIWAIGLATFLLNTSSVMIFGLSAVYMKTILGVATGWIAFLEGAVEACAYLMKLLSGILSDYFKRRQRLMVIGFALAVCARPIFAIFSTFGWVFTARLMDRVGNGLQSTPRDALVGDLAPESIKGRCYGLRQSLAVAGSFFGGIVAMVAMHGTANHYETVFWIAAVPAFLALILLVCFVREPKGMGIPHARQPISVSDISLMGKPYWLLMAVAFVFMSARVSEAMLILYGHTSFHLDDALSPMILILYNGTCSIASYFVGRMSDHVSRRKLLGVGFLVLIAADVVLCTSINQTMLFIGVGIWGVQIGITQSMFMTLIADKVPSHLRGTGFGFFYLLSSLALMLAGALGGFASEHYGQAAVFMYSLIVGITAYILLWSFGRNIDAKRKP